MLNKTDLSAIINGVTEPYFNTVVEHLNNHVIRLGVMTSPYQWHHHPNSDETFIGVEGTVIIETKNEVLELTPGTTITIPKNVVHRTSPKDARSVNMTVERADMETVFEK